MRNYQIVARSSGRVLGTTNASEAGQWLNAGYLLVNASGHYWLESGQVKSGPPGLI